jgi:hypothetical protein
MYLCLEGCANVKNLKSLENSHIVQLNIMKTGVKDARQIMDIPVKCLAFSPSAITNENLLRKHNSIIKICTPDFGISGYGYTNQYWKYVDEETLKH